jgi:hypothetical protein
MGEIQKRPFQLSFNASLRVNFQGSRVTSNGGLILVRELDERLGFGELAAECLTDTRLVSEFNLFILEVLKAWTDPAQKHPKTIHYHGCGRFAVDGEVIRLKSRKR